jgi:hypothetical protein
MCPVDMAKSVAFGATCGLLGRALWLSSRALWTNRFCHRVDVVFAWNDHTPRARVFLVSMGCFLLVFGTAGMGATLFSILAAGYLLVASPVVLSFNLLAVLLVAEVVLLSLSVNLRGIKGSLLRINQTIPGYQDAMEKARETQAVHAILSGRKALNRALKAASPSSASPTRRI